MYSLSDGSNQADLSSPPITPPFYPKHAQLLSTPTTSKSIHLAPLQRHKSSNNRSILAQRKTSRFALTDFRVLRTLGTGSFGRVRLMRSKRNAQYYAVKILSKKEVVRLKQVDHTNNEREILMQIAHPFIVNLWGTFQDHQNLYMVMDYVPGGELFTLLRRMRTFEPRFARFYAAECLLAIAFLHSQHIVYRDLKLENILLDCEGHVRLTDFGFAKRVEDRTWTLCGTPDYLAPEIIELKGYTKAVDCWALGVLIYEMLAGFTPFEDVNVVRQYEKILQCKYKIPAHFDKQVRDLLRRLLTADLTCRLGNLRRGCLDIMDHPWFAGVDFELLAERKVKPPFVPQLRWEGDTSYYDVYDEGKSTDATNTATEPPELDPSNPDPFHAYFAEF
ncbi:kinase-like domain-containing protein [Dichotomocladium elegans]|nr:kinase-like domain-containing protein [Dichotomocladium elegans]